MATPIRGGLAFKPRKNKPREKTSKMERLEQLRKEQEVKKKARERAEQMKNFVGPKETDARNSGLKVRGYGMARGGKVCKMR